MGAVDRGRRRFIAALAAFVASLAGGWRFLVPRRTGEGKSFLTVALSAIPPRGALVYRERQVAVMRDGADIYALNLTCTHLGCTVTVTPSEIVCPCHGSRFDLQGNVLKGPADRPLARYRVENRGERVEIHPI